MDTSRGIIAPLEDFKAEFPEMPEPEFVKRFRPVATVTPRQAITSQVLAYDPCPCGSGNKFKFCCHAKDQSEKTQRQADAAARNFISGLALVRKGATY